MCISLQNYSLILQLEEAHLCIIKGCTTRSKSYKWIPNIYIFQGKPFRSLNKDIEKLFWSIFDYFDFLYQVYESKKGRKNKMLHKIIMIWKIAVARLWNMRSLVQNGTNPDKWCMVPCKVLHVTHIQDGKVCVCAQ